jgi:hypothetical protein
MRALEVLAKITDKVLPYPYKRKKKKKRIGAKNKAAIPYKEEKRQR